MAKQSKPAVIGKRTVQVDEDDEGIVAQEADSEETAPTNSEAPKLSEEADDMVTFVCLEEVDPAPVVGQYRFRDHGVSKLEKMKNYTVPRSVAEHLVDRKKGSIVG